MITELDSTKIIDSMVSELLHHNLSLSVYTGNNWSEPCSTKEDVINHLVPDTNIIIRVWFNIWFVGIISLEFDSRELLSNMSHDVIPYVQKTIQLVKDININ